MVKRIQIMGLETKGDALKLHFLSHRIVLFMDVVMPVVVHMKLIPVCFSSISCSSASGGGFAGG